MGTEKFEDEVWRWLANHLPRRLVYFAGMRLWIHGTWGKYSDTEVPSLLMVDALKRWEEEE